MPLAGASASVTVARDRRALDRIAGGQAAQRDISIFGRAFLYRAGGDGVPVTALSWVSVNDTFTRSGLPSSAPFGV